MRDFCHGYHRHPGELSDCGVFVARENEQHVQLQAGAAARRLEEEVPLAAA
jgi:hypothetical protein